MSSLTMAFIFPGQGSQSSTMLQPILEHPETKALVTEASEVLGYDLAELVANNPENKLNQTTYTQPALLVASVAHWERWQLEKGPMPTVMAGHSLGEYSALVCAGAIAFPDAVALVAERGRLMQAAVSEGVGGMAAIIGLDELTIEQICKELNNEASVVVPANYNAHGQTVIAGHKAAVLKAMDAMKVAGAKLTKALPVSVPSHTPLMQSAAQGLMLYLEKVDITSPNLPVLHNVNVQAINSPEAIKDALVQQLTNPVRWVETINFLAEKSVDLAIECGPGKVLTGLSKRITPDLPTLPINNPQMLTEALEKI